MTELAASQAGGGSLQLLQAERYLYCSDCCKPTHNAGPFASLQLYSTTTSTTVVVELVIATLLATSSRSKPSSFTV
jgi:hypothetical protein